MNDLKPGWQLRVPLTPRQKYALRLVYKGQDRYDVLDVGMELQAMFPPKRRPDAKPPEPRNTGDQVAGLLICYEFIASCPITGRYTATPLGVLRLALESCT